MALSGNFVAYYQVSTQKQGNSGLGFEAQQAAVANYLNGGNWKIVDAFKEIESGKSSDRPELAKALAKAKLLQCPVVVAKVDRLTRSVAFLSRLLEAGVDVRFADLPQIEGPTGRFMLQQMASVAELEAGLISARTKAALAASKKKLGGRRKNGHNFNADDSAKAVATLQKHANDLAQRVAPAIKELQAAGKTSLRAIAEGLNEQGIPTSRGGKWSSPQVMRVLDHRAGSRR
jgi:DNA invertase Pin-like site-specific DNA recombinase